MTAADILPDVVITVPRGYRRIIGVIGDRAIYCRGADVKRDCKLATLVRWARQANAKVTHQPKGD